MPRTELLGHLLPELGSHADLAVTGVDSDSRRLLAGGLFVGLGNRHGDARHFLAAAWAAGAVAALLEGPTAEASQDQGRPVWIRPDARALLGQALRRWVGWPEGDSSPLLIGVTGTNGKSSVTRLLAQLAPMPAHILGTLGHGPVDALTPLPNTTPEAVQLWSLLAESRDAGAQVVAMEVSSHALALERVAGIPFRVAVFTNLSQDHLDFHGDMASYGAAKARLFHTPGLELASLNADDPFSQQLGQELSAHNTRVVTWGWQAGDWRVRDYHPGASGTLLILDTPQGSQRLRSPLLGRSNVDNLLAALSVADALGWTLTDADIARLSLPAGRYQRLPVPAAQRPQVMVDYAHSPDALERVLQDLREVAKGQVTVVFGCGGDRDRGKRPQMGAIAARLADRVVLTSDNPRSEDPETILDDITAGMPQPPALREVDRAQAITTAITTANSGDWVLIAGKGHETYQEQQGQRRPFDDVAVAMEALQR